MLQSPRSTIKPKSSGATEFNQLDAPRFPRPAYFNNVSTDSLLGTVTPMSGTTTACPTPSLTSGQGSPELGKAFDPFSLEDRKPTVVKLADADDIDHMASWKQTLYKFSPLMSVCSLAAYWVYFIYRVKYTVDAQRVAHKTFYMAWAFIVVELGVAFPMFLHQMWSCLMLKGRKRAKLRLIGDVCPTVDVFVTCCGEDTDIVLDTTRAACAVDYPSNRFRVIVLDDGGSAELAKGVRGLQEQYPNVHYSARVKIKGVPHHYKAGNLNHGLGYVTKMPGGAGEYMAALDADMIPEPAWLRAIMAHLVVDPKLALSCPPQLFYNVPTDDPLLQSLDVFVHISEPIKDTLGVAWCTGSGYAIRRTAIDELGGFPIGSLAEDVCTSSMLLGAGWKTAYVHEPLQYGTVPESFVGHLKQRTRWTIGTIQTSVKLRFCLFGPLIRKMTFYQRLSGFVYTISSLFTIFLTASLFTMPIVLVSGGTMVAYADYGQLRMLIRLCFIALVMNRLNEFVLYTPAGYRLGLKESRAMMWMAPYLAIIVVRFFFLPSWLGGSSAGFSASGSIANDLNERDPATRAPMFRRLKAILWDCRAIMHLLYILFCLAAVTRATVSAFKDSHNTTEILVSLLTHACWPPMLWFICLTACWIPIHYAISPPDMPDREELLDRDPKTGVAHPKPSAKTVQWSKTNSIHEVFYTIFSVFTAVMFFGSFWV